MIIKKMKNTKITNMKTGRGTKRVQSLASNLARNSPCNTKHTEQLLLMGQIRFSKWI